MRTKRVQRWHQYDVVGDGEDMAMVDLRGEESERERELWREE